MDAWKPLTTPLALEPSLVHVVRIGLDADESSLHELRSLLSSDEAARAARYKVELPRRHFIICRAILRRLLASCLACDPRGVEFEYGAHGKPALCQSTHSGQDVRFSVSHSSDQALIAVARGRQVGVDIERIDPTVRILKLANRFFSPREAQELAGLPSCDQPGGFYKGWTCKEAYLKGTGFGLSFPLNHFSVSLNPHQPARLIEVVDQPSELTRWRLLSLDHSPDFAAALLYESATGEPVSVIQWALTIRDSLGLVSSVC